MSPGGVRSAGGGDDGASIVAGIRDRAEETLAAFLTDQRAELEGLHAGGGRPVEEIQRLVGAGGKRLRPIMCVLGHLAGGGAVEEPILRAAGAFELLHTFALVHDDLMDGTPLRRGVPASHVVLGTAGAVLAGDLALVLADRLLLSSRFPPGRLIPALERWTSMRVAMGVGQHADVTGPGTADPGQVARVAGLKSADYTVTGPLDVGALLAGDGPPVREALRRIGEPLGAAFQLADDLAGVLEGEGGEGTDLALERPNAVVAMARGMAPPAEARLLDELAARGQLDGAERERVREVVLSTGAVDRVRNLAGRLIDEAGRAIEAAELPGDVAGPLADLARQIGEGTR